MAMMVKSGSKTLNVMKKHIFFQCVAAMTLLASCAAPELDPEIQTPGGETDKPKQTITINAIESLPDDATKAIHGTEAEATSFSWQAGIDKIGVIKKYSDAEEWSMDHHRFTNTADGSIATFVYDKDEEGMGMVSGVCKPMVIHTPFFCI